MRRKVLTIVLLLGLALMFSGCAGTFGYKGSDHSSRRYLYGYRGDNGRLGAGGWAISIGQR